MYARSSAVVLVGIVVLTIACLPLGESVGIRQRRAKTIVSDSIVNDNSDSKLANSLLQGQSNSFLQTGAQVKAGTSFSGEHGFCELCIYSIHQVQYGALPTCGGQSKTMSSSSCSQVVQSMLSYAHDVMHLISYGCYQYDPYKGWQTVKPCPAHVICGRLPNIYDHGKESMCPADYHFRFPHALASVAPTVTNPLLPYAIKQYQNKGASSILQSPGAPSKEGPLLRGIAPASFSPLGPGAFPRHMGAANVYAQQTNPLLAAGNPHSPSAQPVGLPAGSRSAGTSLGLLETKSEKPTKENNPRFLLDGIELPFKQTGAAI